MPTYSLIKRSSCPVCQSIFLADTTIPEITCPVCAAPLQYRQLTLLVTDAKGTPISTRAETSILQLDPNRLIPGALAECTLKAGKHWLWLIRNDMFTPCKKPSPSAEPEGAPSDDYKPWWKDDILQESINSPLMNQDFAEERISCETYATLCAKKPSAFKPSRPSADTPSLLQEADALISGERAEQYGDATDSFTHIAELWGAYLGQPLQPADVAVCMALLKFSRMKHSGYSHHDSFVDAAGYVALAERVAK